MNGRITSVSGQIITFVDSASGASKTCAVATDATITLNGAKATLAELKAGDNVSLSGGPPYTTVTATR